MVDRQIFLKLANKWCHPYQCLHIARIGGNYTMGTEGDASLPSFYLWRTLSLFWSSEGATGKSKIAFLSYIIIY
jgi:hypothetical protein